MRTLAFMKSIQVVAIMADVEGGYRDGIGPTALDNIVNVGLSARLL